MNSRMPSIVKRPKRLDSSATTPARHGIAQLTLVEHSLCPLHSSGIGEVSRTHVSRFAYRDPSGRKQTGTARVYCPKGLLPSDEFFLWGLLALTCSQPKLEPEFHATPHYCLRELGVIDTDSRGGKNYQLFRQALARLAAVTYQCDRFYDPIRREHADVSFGFLSYRLPLDPHSSRAWRIVWDSLFLEMLGAVGGKLSFDLETYRGLDAASRRLFLLLQKVFWRRRVSPVFDVRHLAVDVLGFSPSLSQPDLNRKVKTVAQRLLASRLIAMPPGVTDPAELVQRMGRGDFRVQFVRGAYFDRPIQRPNRSTTERSPLFEVLQSVGLEVAAIRRILAQNEHSLVREWADITLAAKERFGEKFFSKSSQAFFLDNLKHARTGRRQPPDWWRELNKSEQRQQDQAVWQSISNLFPTPTVTPATKMASPGGLQRIGTLVGSAKQSS